jgi:hypothetical protein
MRPTRKLGTKKLSPVTTAIILILVLGAVLYVYTKGLLGQKKAGGMAKGGGGGMAAVVQPPRGLPSAQVTTVAGYLQPGSADGKGWEARFNGPAGIALSPDGSLYVSDSRNHRLRRIAPDMTVTTVAGSGPTDCLPGGFLDGPANEARLFNPSGLAVAKDGAVYFADSGNHRIRKLQDGVVSTVAGSATEKDDVGCEQGGYRDGPALTAQFRFPAAVSVDASGAIWVADMGNGRLRRVANGTVTTPANLPLLKQPAGLAAGTGAAPAVADPGSGVLLEPGADGKLVARPRGGVPPKSPEAMCRLASDPRVWAVVDSEWHAVFLLNDTTSVLLAGELPPAPRAGFKDAGGDTAKFAWPSGVASVGDRLFVSDYENNCIRAITVPPDWSVPLPPPRQWQLPPNRRDRREGDRSAD